MIGSPALLFAVAVVVTFATDQLSKWLVVERLDLRNLYHIDVFPPLLRFRMGWNEGINFGLFSGAPEMTRWILIGVALIVCVWVAVWVLRDGRGRVVVAGGLLVGGALGNVIDRVRFGAVADFLNMSCCGITNPYTFNVADIGVFAGAIGLLLFSGHKNAS